MSVGQIVAQIIPPSVSELPPASGLLPLALPSIALCAAAVAILLLAVIVAGRLKSAWGRSEINNPRRLLRQLCEAHGFRGRQQRQLQKAAMTLGLKQPAKFFLEPSLLKQAAEHPRLRGSREEILQIAGELFGSSARD